MVLQQKVVDLAVVEMEQQMLMLDQELQGKEMLEVMELVLQEVLEGGQEQLEASQLQVGQAVLVTLLL
jgi:hypothetical protein